MDKLEELKVKLSNTTRCDVELTLWKDLNIRLNSDQEEVNITLGTPCAGFVKFPIYPVPQDKNPLEETIREARTKGHIFGFIDYDLAHDLRNMYRKSPECLQRLNEDIEDREKLQKVNTGTVEEAANHIKEHYLDHIQQASDEITHRVQDLPGKFQMLQMYKEEREKERELHPIKAALQRYYFKIRDFLIFGRSRNDPQSGINTNGESILAWQLLTLASRIATYEFSMNAEVLEARQQLKLAEQFRDLATFYGTISTTADDTQELIARFTIDARKAIGELSGMRYTLPDLDEHRLHIVKHVLKVPYEFVKKKYELNNLHKKTGYLM